MADWQTISSLATAAGTLVLAAVTYTAVRSSNRSARVAERALLAGMRPVLVPSLRDDPDQKVLWLGGVTRVLPGGRAIAEYDDEAVYLAIGVRNVGTGLAVLHGWHPTPGFLGATDPRGDLDEFTRQLIDLYIPSGGAGYWEGALRDADTEPHGDLRRIIDVREQFTVDLLYGDQDGGQRALSRFAVLPTGDGGWYSQVVRHWQIDRDDPR
jgi:hypothetical protein